MCINQQIRCPQLIIPNDGQLIGSCLNFAGSTCIIQCYNNPVSPPVINSVCHLNGSWSEPNPCYTQPTPPPVNCPPIVGLLNGRVDGPNNCSPGFPGSSCSFTCNPGYSLTGLSRLVCSSTGSWSGNVPTCVQRVCPPLVASGFNPATTLLTGNCSPGIVGTTCNFQCLRGYTLIGGGSGTFLCTESGEWSPPSSSPPSCVPVSCPSLSPPANGQLDGSCSPGKALEPCSLSCSQCFTPSSNPSLTCTETGQWSDPLPSCTPITCPRLPVPLIGSYSGPCNPGLCGQACLLNCGPNYATPVIPLLCTSSGWSTETMPTCQLKNCPPLPPITNGQYEGACSPGLAGSSCTYQCNYGYALVGRPKFDCLPETGNWTLGSLPVCTPVTCSPIVPPSGGSVNGNCSAGASLGSTCSIVCAPNLNLQGEPTLTCTANGSWNAPTPSCIEAPPITCPPLVPPSSGQLIGTCSPGYAGRTCLVQCSESTIPSNPTGVELTCLPNGSWNAPVPLCLSIPCPAIQAPVNGFTRGDCSPGLPGKLCSVGCENGYVLQNGKPQVIECYANGSWSAGWNNGSPPTCQMITCEPLAPPSPNGGLQGSCNPGFVGEQCSFTCPLGYRLIGATNTLCQPNGTWSAIPPFCMLASCPSLTTPLCGYAYGTCAPGSLGESCTFTCAQGCYLEGAEVLTCLQGGRWSNVQPICRASDPEQTTTTVATTTESEPEPDPDPDPDPDPYPDPDPDPDPEPDPDPDPDPTTTSSPLILCPALRPPRGAVLYGKCAPGIHKATCTVVCSRGYRLLGTLKVTCTNSGRWSGRLGVCRKAAAQYCTAGTCCRPPTTPLNGVFSRCNNSVGGKCRLTCLSGYKANIVQPLTCQTNGAWNYDPDSVKCIRLTKTVMFVWKWLG